MFTRQGKKYAVAALVLVIIGVVVALAITVWKKPAVEDTDTTASISMTQEAAAPKYVIG